MITMTNRKVKEKLKGYPVHYSKSALREAIQRKEKIWNSELNQLIADVPQFEEVLAQIEERS